jgi:hypothetical protein
MIESADKKVLDAPESPDSDEISNMADRIFSQLQ